MAFEAFLMSFLANVASDTVGVTVKSLYEKIMDFKHHDNYHHFCDMLDVMERHLNEIQSSSSQRHAEFSPAVESCIKRLVSILRDAKSLVPKAPPSFFRSLTVHTSIENAKRRLEDGFKDLDSILARQDWMNKMAPVPLMQPEPQTGFVGDVIKDLEEKVLKLLHQDNPAQIIVVYGMGGVGKTTLLNKVYNSVIKENSVFKISCQTWLTISQEYEVAKLQRILATNAGMQARDTEDEEGLKMRLAECFKTRKFFVVLDDVWSEDFDVLKLGLVFGNGNHGSKVVITTRNTGVARKMGLAKFTKHVEVPTLTEEDAWKMFRLWSFGSLDMDADSLSAEQLHTAKVVCKECKGLPLAIKVVAVSFPKDGSLSDQQFFLMRLGMIDPLFARSEQRELFTKLKLSYDLLPTQELKECFLYTACMFAEDTQIDVDSLIRMWICEGFLKGPVSGCENGYYFSKQEGTHILKHLSNRCLISISVYSVFFKRDNVQDRTRIHVHDCIRDMALMVGRGETHSYAFASNISGHGDLKRLSLHESDICELPSESPHSDMISLNLSSCTKINKVPNGFFTQHSSLKVLDLSHSSVPSLPSSIGNLSSLELLDLSGCQYIDCLPDELCTLPNLRVLDISHSKIKTLPSRIGNLTTLKEFRLSFITHIPKSLACLTSLQVLKICLDQNEGPTKAEVFDLKDLTGLRKLQYLYFNFSATQYHESKEIDCECWSQMKRLHFVVGDKIVKIPEVFSKIFENMVQLENLELDNCGSFLLPGNVSNIQSLTIRRISGVPFLGNFLNLKLLTITHCTIEALEIRKTIQEIFVMACPKLKQLVWPDDDCALKKLRVWQCEDLKSVGIGKETHLKCLEVVVLSNLNSLEEFGEEQDQWNRDRFPALRWFDMRKITPSEACMGRLQDVRRKILS